MNAERPPPPLRNACWPACRGPLWGLHMTLLAIARLIGADAVGTVVIACRMGGLRQATRQRREALMAKVLSQHGPRFDEV
jgi:hypothetical protein